MNDTLDDVKRWADRGDRIAIAMVVGARRSAPRPLGTKMAINDRGEISGSVSGGCVEGAVVEIAERVIGSGHPEQAGAKLVITPDAGRLASLRSAEADAEAASVASELLWTDVSTRRGDLFIDVVGPALTASRLEGTPERMVAEER